MQIARAAMQVVFPARPLLVTAMNPCPCGWAGDPSGRCDCPSEAITRYQSRVSGPLLDRIDLNVALARVPAAALMRDTSRAAAAKASSPAESSAVVRARVIAARERQQARQGKPNAHLAPGELDGIVAATPAARLLLERAADRLMLSARAVHRVLRVARTLADLGHEPAVDTPQMAEAIGFRAPAHDARGHAGGTTVAPRATLPTPLHEEPTDAHGVAGTH